MAIVDPRGTRVDRDQKWSIANSLDLSHSPLFRAEKTLERTPEEIANLAFLMAFQFVRSKGMRLMPERVDDQLRRHVKSMTLEQVVCMPKRG